MDLVVLEFPLKFDDTRLFRMIPWPRNNIIVISAFLMVKKKIMLFYAPAPILSSERKVAF